MIENTFKVKEEAGLVSQNCVEICKVANKYSCTVIAKYNKKMIDAKSIMGLLSLGAKHNDEITFVAEGEDCKELFTELNNLAF